MTQSVSRKAFDTLMKVLSLGAGEELPYHWTNGRKQYSMELGREHKTGAITGTIYDITPNVLGDAKKTRAGYIRINADGYIQRWPHANKEMLEIIHKLNGEDKVVL